MRAAQVVIIAATVGCAAAATPRWPSMTPAEKLAFMEKTVTPRMNAVFTEFDRHRYPRVTCATCHGPDGERRGFTMPNPDLLLEPAAAVRGHGDELDAFMRERVAPEMARLLGRAPDCFSCHTPDR